MISIHEKIKFHRERLGLTFQQFADELGVAWQTVQQWEKNTAPKRTRMAQVAEVLGVSVSSLTTDDEPSSGQMFSNLSDEDRLKLEAHLAESPPELPYHSVDIDVSKYTYEELLAVLIAKLVADGHPADIEAAPMDVKRGLDKALRPNAKFQGDPLIEHTPKKFAASR